MTPPPGPPAPPGGPPPTAPRLRATGIDKRFPGVVALSGVSLTLAPGEVLAVVGENGAGKSTLMSILYGLTAPDAGEIRLRGEPVRLARGCGILRIARGRRQRGAGYHRV